jgi:hypothetical protein
MVSFFLKKFFFEILGRTAHPGRSSSVLNNTSGGRPRSRSGTGTPVSYAKRTKLEPEEGDGELEIDVCLFF